MGELEILGHKYTKNSLIVISERWDDFKDNDQKQCFIVEFLMEFMSYTFSKYPRLENMETALICEKHK